MKGQSTHLHGQSKLAMMLGYCKGNHCSSKQEFLVRVSFAQDEEIAGVVNKWLSLLASQ